MMLLFSSFHLPIKQGTTDMTKSGNRGSQMVPNLSYLLYFWISTKAALCLLAAPSSSDSNFPSTKSKQMISDTAPSAVWDALLSKTWKNVYGDIKKIGNWTNQGVKVISICSVLTCCMQSSAFSPKKKVFLCLSPNMDAYQHVRTIFINSNKSSIHLKWRLHNAFKMIFSI